MTTPRRHHYVTKSYLQGFCTGPVRKKKFWTYDLEQRKWRRSQPINEAVEKDFQKLDHFIGLDPYFLEKEFGEIEGLAVEVIRKIILNKRLPPTIKEFSPVINLMGILAGRNLVTRKMVDELYKQTSLKTLTLILANENTYYGQMKKAQAAGEIQEPITPYQEAKDFFHSRKFKIETDPSVIVEHLAKGAVQIVDLLGCRSWMLVESAGIQFITSNKPVNAIWAIGFLPFVPGFGLINSLVTFPIAPNLALLGSWSPLPAYRLIDSLVVEGINWATACTGATMIYAQDQTAMPIFQGVSHLQDFHRLLPTRLIQST